MRLPGQDAATGLATDCCCPGHPFQTLHMGGGKPGWLAQCDVFCLVRCVRQSRWYCLPMSMLCMPKDLQEPG